MRIFIAAAGALLAATASAPGGVDAFWTSPESGLWTDGSKWSTSPAFPDGLATGTELFSPHLEVVGQPYIVTLGEPVLIDQLFLNSPDATLHQTGGTLTLYSGAELTAGTYRMHTGVIEFGHINNTGALFLVGGGPEGFGSIFDDVQYVGNITIHHESGGPVGPGAHLTLQNGSSITGEVRLTGHQPGLDFPGIEELEDLTIIFDTDLNGNGIATLGLNHATLAESVVIRGARGFIQRPIGSGSGEGSLLNRGLISADVPGGELYVAPPDVFVNEGVLEARNGGILFLSGVDNNGVIRVVDSTLYLGALNFADVGTLDVQGDSVINLQGTYGSGDGAIFTIDTSIAEWRLVGGLRNIYFRVIGPDPLLVRSSVNSQTGEIDITGDVTIEGSLVFSEGAIVIVEGTFNLIGEADLTAPNIQIGMPFNGSRIQGGTFILRGSPGQPNYIGSVQPRGFNCSANIREHTYGEDVVIRAGHAVLGAAIPLRRACNTRLVNRGVISAEFPGEPVQIMPSHGFVNYGRLQAINGGQMTVASSGWVNNGALHVASGGQIGVAGSIFQGAGASMSCVVDWTVDQDGVGQWRTGRAFAGGVSLAGPLHIELGTIDEGAVPRIGDTIPLITASSVLGDFDEIVQPPFGSPFGFEVMRVPGGVSLVVTERCDADVNLDEQADVFDLLAFLDLWFQASSSANLDGIGAVDVLDLLIYLTAWFDGCS